MDRIVVIDVGNTSTSISVARGKTIQRPLRIKGTSKTDIQSVLDNIASKSDIQGAVLCSVVPAANMVWVSLIKRTLGTYPIVVNHKTKLGINIDYPKPALIGADRLANACGAADKYGAPVIVADFGTALTFDVICKHKGYVGGVIAPGLPLMTDYLADKTALLPHIELKGSCSSVGKSTEGAMRIGAKIGYRGMVREIVNHLKDTTGYRSLSLCATGGYAKWAIGDLDMDFKIDPNLTLYGLSRIYELNR